MHELIEPALAIVHRLGGVVFQLRVVGVETAADTRMARAIDPSIGLNCGAGQESYRHVDFDLLNQKRLNGIKWIVPNFTFK
jgi:hypothetical protein